MIRLLLAAVFLAAPVVPALRAQATAEPRQELRFTTHALLRMKERGITEAQVRLAVERGESFPYFHQDRWKKGFFDDKARLFVATNAGLVITVFPNATRAYADKLKRRKP